MPRNIQNPIWELVFHRDGDEVERLPVSGGWLYRTIIRDPGYAPAVAMAFVRAPTSRRSPPS